MPVLRRKNSSQELLANLQKSHPANEACVSLNLDRRANAPRLARSLAHSLVPRASFARQVNCNSRSPQVR